MKEKNIIEIFDRKKEYKETLIIYKNKIDHMRIVYSYYPAILSLVLIKYF